MRDPDVLDPRGVDAEPAPTVVPAPRTRRRWTDVAVEVEAMAADEGVPATRYQWDADTEILAVQVVDRRSGGTTPTSLELEGKDGSWITLELRGARVVGLEVAVWPPVRLRSELAPPLDPHPGHVRVPAVLALGAAIDVEVDTLLAVEADRRRRTYRLRVGRPRPARAVRVGRDILLDVDEAGRLAGLWLLNVPAQPIPH